MAVAELMVAGRVYRLPCSPEQEAHLKALAAQFEARAGMIAGALSGLDQETVFLAAGLSLIDEMAEAAAAAPVVAAEPAAAGEQGAGPGGALADGADVRVAERLARALTLAAERIEALVEEIDTAG